MADDRWQPDSFDDLLGGLTGGLPELAANARGAEFDLAHEFAVDAAIVPRGRPPREARRTSMARTSMFAPAPPEAPPIDFGPAPITAEDTGRSATSDAAAPDPPPPSTHAAPHGDALRDALTLLKQLTRDTAEIRELLKRRETHDRPAHFAPPMYST